MYDVVCPVCQSMIEVPAQAIESKTACRCPKCWSWLRVVGSHPLRLEAGSEDLAMSSAPSRRAMRLGEEDEES